MKNQLSRPAVVLMLVLFCLLDRPFATAQLSNKPPDKNAYLFDVHTNFISDAQFAALISNKFFGGGTTNVRDAKFIFQQCYGGGMLNEIQNSLGTTNSAIPWVGGSAASWYEPSWGWADIYTHWSRQFYRIFDTNQSLHANITNTIANDPMRPGNGAFGSTNGVPIEEHGQSAYGGGGTNITLRDTNALSHHAILWAGIADRGDLNDIYFMRQMLTNAWAGNTNVSVTVLFGNGTNDPNYNADTASNWDFRPATISNLIQAINSLPLNSNEQFFFYSTDHGGSRTHIMALTSTPVQVNPGTNDLEYFILETGELLGLQLGAASLPTLDIDYTGVTTANTNAVFLNDVFLGFLDPLLTSMQFSVPILALALSNTVEIENNEDEFFDLLHKSFFTGAIDILHVVPEPSLFSLLFVGTVCIGLLRRRSQPKR